MKIHLEGEYKSGDVTMNGKPLDPTRSLNVYNHSPTGFLWGYNGSGPAQLALAILLEFTTREIALKNYQTFKNKVIAALPQNDFNVTIDLTPYLK